MSVQRRLTPTTPPTTQPAPRPPWMERAFDLLRTGQVVEWNAQRLRRPGWRPDLTTIDMAGRRYDGAALRHARLSGMTLPAVSFVGADLSHADLAGADLTNADLSGANLVQTDLTGARLDGANLSGANLTRARLENASLADANLTGCTLHEVRAARARLPRTSLRNARGSRADFSRARLDHATLAYARFDGASFLHASMRTTELRHAGFGPFANLGGADLRGAKGLRLDGEYIRGARFQTHQREAYLALRRAYAGARTTVIATLLLIVLAPVGWRAFDGARTNTERAAIIELGIDIQQRDAAGGDLASLGGALIHAAAPDPGDRVHEVWEVLLGLDRGWATTTFIGATLGVLLLRLWLTVRVSDLRQGEERSGHAPQWREVRSWWCCHTLAMQAGLLAVLIGVGFSAARWIRGEIVATPAPDLFQGLMPGGL